MSPFSQCSRRTDGRNWSSKWRHYIIYELIKSASAAKKVQMRPFQPAKMKKDTPFQGLFLTIFLRHSPQTMPQTRLILGGATAPPPNFNPSVLRRFVPPAPRIVRERTSAGLNLLGRIQLVKNFGSDLPKC